MTTTTSPLTWRDAPPPTSHPHLSLLSNAVPPKPEWSPSTAIPPGSLSGNVAIVTGGYNGIGLETVDALLRASSDVWIFGRSTSNWSKALDQLKTRQGLRFSLREHEREQGVGQLLFQEMDLGDLHTIRTAVKAFLQQESKLHMLYCSAGVMTPPFGSRTSHSHEMQFGTNVLGHHYLIKLLLPALLSSKTPEFTPRICLTSSVGHLSGRFTSGPAFSADDPFLEKSMSGWLPGFLKASLLYGHSKMGNILQASKLHRTYFLGEGAQGGEEEGGGGRLIVTSVHPGVLKTSLTRHLFPPNASLMDYVNGLFTCYVVWPLAAYPAWYGALNQVYACTLPDQDAFRVGLSGSYIVPWCRLGKADPKSEDKKAQDELWDWCEGEVKRIIKDDQTGEK